MQLKNGGKPSTHNHYGQQMSNVFMGQRECQNGSNVEKRVDYGAGSHAIKRDNYGQQTSGIQKNI